MRWLRPAHRAAHGCRPMARTPASKSGDSYSIRLIPAVPGVPGCLLRSMRILFFADNFPPETNAQASRVFERARYWIRWGHSVTVITCAPNFPEGKVYPGFENRWHQTEVMAGIRVVRVKTFMAANRGKLRRMADYLSFLPVAVWAGLFEQRHRTSSRPLAVRRCSLHWPAGR